MRKYTMAQPIKKQQRFFKLVHEVQTGKKSPSEVPDNVRKMARKIGVRDSANFVSSKAQLREKRAVLAMLKELREPMNLQEDEKETNPVAKQFTVKDDYEAYVKRHVGQPFDPKELEAVDNFQESQATKIERTEIRYETTDSFSNSTTVVIKKMKDSGQLSFIAFTKHSKIEPEEDEESMEEPMVPDSSETNGPGAPAPEPTPEPESPTEEKDDVIIFKSILFTDEIKGGAILSDFLKKLDI